ncbi:MAG: hypothetical protein KJ550_09610 [Proteobacteria bacterium]|nr:hypothetical protein [Desulfobacteraceae bacterium]MBU4013711.1 hypothetical protein [Pseudomonadota bacterium]MBU4067124.1 hypothetical protein [Pseudomonadota bacterium]MBU4101800.1 hypothetical protein [Pseudomonadota bacterium]MBU4127077.1 hypothetical protein [Pseudomonadota bacterium]
MGNIADGDPVARRALWGGIQRSSQMLAGKCSVFVTEKPIDIGRVNSGIPEPDVETWKLMEALSLLAVLLKAELIITTDICNIFGKAGPFHFSEGGADRYLWAQATLIGEESSLSGRPDLVVTSDPNRPSASNILQIIECKSGKQIGAPQIRAEFGKAYDLKVSSYLMWSFVTPSKGAIDGAKKLGIDLEPLWVDDDMREALIDNPDVLVSHVANTVEQSRKGARLLSVIKTNTELFNSKFLLST